MAADLTIEEWEPAEGDRIIYCGSRSDYDAIPGVVTSVKTLHGVESIVLRLTDGRVVTTVKRTLSPDVEAARQ